MWCPTSRRRASTTCSEVADDRHPAVVDGTDEFVVVLLGAISVGLGEPGQRPIEGVIVTDVPGNHRRIARPGVRASERHHLRPLSPGGHARAEVLADLLELTSASHIVSSPYVRCVQTVEPLAARQLLSVEISDTLAEGASVEATVHLL